MPETANLQALNVHVTTTHRHISVRKSKLVQDFGVECLLMWLCLRCLPVRFTCRVHVPEETAGACKDVQTCSVQSSLKAKLGGMALACS